MEDYCCVYCQEKDKSFSKLISESCPEHPNGKNKGNHFAKQSPHFNQGSLINTNITLVFSCPGQWEKIMKKPVSGQTGTNLDFVLKCLFNRKKIISEEFISRYDYRITNASHRVHYQKETKDTEDKDKEFLYSDKNLFRLCQETKGTEFIICFGKVAQDIVKRMKDKYNIKVKLINVRHLSFQSINHIKYTDTKMDNTLSHTQNRLFKVAEDIIRQSKISI